MFVGILHLAALVLSFYVFESKRPLFIASEIVILISLFIAWRLYQELIRPLKMLMQGVDAIKDKDFNIKFVHTGKHEMDKLIEVYNHMIDQLRSERVQQEQQHFFLEKLIFTSPTGIIILDYNEQIQQINPKALALLGMDDGEFRNTSLDELQHPVFQFIKQLRSGESRTISLSGVATYKLQKSHFIDRGFPRHFVMIEELTAEILAAEKKVYEKVIRMMAHEVNNTIGPVNSIIDSALRLPTLWNNPQHQSLKDAIQVAVNRNNNLNVFMRNFADLVKLPEPVRRVMDVHQVLTSVARLMEAKAAEKQAVISLALWRGPWMVQADEQQLEQAFINIIKNSVEAMEGGGTVTISTHPASGRIVVADTGMGIKDDAAEHLFSPFYSTKKDGQGIGLTLVREILMNHGYTFTLKTHQPGDTRFTVKL